MLREYGITEEEYDKYAGVYKNALEEIKIAEGVDPGKEPPEERQKQINEVKQYVEEMQLFYEYYKRWIDVCKKGAIREATMSKYLMTQKWVEKLAPNLKISELTRTAYQKLLNDPEGFSEDLIDAVKLILSR